jgi:hypothetical protein
MKKIIIIVGIVMAVVLVGIGFFLFSTFHGGSTGTMAQAAHNAKKCVGGNVCIAGPLYPIRRNT